MFFLKVLSLKKTSGTNYEKNPGMLQVKFSQLIKRVKTNSLLFCAPSTSFLQRSACGTPGKDQIFQKNPARIRCPSLGLLELSYCKDFYFNLIAYWKVNITLASSTHDSMISLFQNHGLQPSSGSTQSTMIVSLESSGNPSVCSCIQTNGSDIIILPSPAPPPNEINQQNQQLTNHLVPIRELKHDQVQGR